MGTHLTENLSTMKVFFLVILFAVANAKSIEDDTYLRDDDDGGMPPLPDLRFDDDGGMPPLPDLRLDDGGMPPLPERFDDGGMPPTARYETRRTNNRKLKNLNIKFE